MEFIYQVVSPKEEGSFFVASKEFTFDELKANFTIDGVNENLRNRPELIGQPKIAHFLGPMYGGEKNGQTVIRYESQTAYNLLSQ